MRHELLGGAALTACVAFGVWHVYPDYAKLRFYVDYKQESKRYSRWIERNKTVAWMRGNTAPRDVILASTKIAFRVVTTAGRKTVVSTPNHSNPFIDWSAREGAQKQMFRALERGDTKFLRLAREYLVSYVLITTNDLSPKSDLRRLPFLEEAFSYRDMAIYRVIDADTE
jgi:hypothetical protein